MTTTSKVSLSLLGRHFTLRSEGLFMAWLFSPKKKLSKRFLKRSGPLFFREMAHEGSTRGSFLRDVFGTSPYFSERMAQVASTRPKREPVQPPEQRRSELDAGHEQEHEQEHMKRHQNPRC